jgi:outer membrane protein assembly factor BamB
VGVVISKPARRWAAAIGVLALLAVLAVLGLKVLSPRDMLTEPTVPFPSPTSDVNSRPFGSHRVMPLVADGLRIHAEKRRVWAEGPVDERQETVPYWAFRRWPAQLVGVARTGKVIVSQWSDGELIAIDLHAGSIAWRAAAPVAQESYDGRRTGATTVYEPAGLLVVTADDGRAAVVVSAPGTVRAFDGATGDALYAHDVTAGCQPAVWSTAGLLAVPPCGGTDLALLNPRTGAKVSSWQAPAAPAPAACALGRTDCALVVAGSEARQPRPDGTLRPLPAALATAVTKADAVYRADGLVVTSAAGVVTATPLDTGDPRWSIANAGKLVAANAAGAYVISDDRAVKRLDTATGATVGVGCAIGKYDEPWQVGRAYATDDGAYLAVERVTGEPASTGDNEYFWSLRPVALAQLYPVGSVPEWEPRFGSCPSVQ